MRQVQSMRRVSGWLNAWAGGRSHPVWRGFLPVLARYAGWIVLAVLFALALGVAGAWLLQRLSGADRATAFFAMAVGGASEMAVQGERHGAMVDRVAAAHSLRIMMVVGTIPFI